MVGGIAVVAILAFTIYKVSRNRRAAAAHVNSEDYYAAYPEGVQQPGYNGPGKQQGMQETGFQRQSLRYPEDEPGGVSANLRQEI